MTLLDNIIKTPIVHTFGESRLRHLLLSTPLSEGYWRITPWIHQRERHLSPKHVNPPIDPFQLFFVTPDRITRFTGRPFPPWETRWQDFGAVVDGDWDQRTFPPIRSHDGGGDPSLYLAERFSETRLHRGLVDHFVDGVPWRDVDFVNELIDTVSSTDRVVWQGLTTVAEVRWYCTELDQLYRSMRDRGCLSIRELNAKNNRQMSFQTVMENEILVDITRTGEPRFVTGRHRLSMAKILNLDRIPVAVVARHPGWINDRGGTPYTGSVLENGASSGAESAVLEPFNVSW